MRMRQWREQAGIPEGYTLHGLRRTFGTYLAECNVQARAIMDAMGHTSMAVTDGYVRDANRDKAMVGIASASRNVMRRSGVQHCESSAEVTTRALALGTS
ncbi:integrase [Mycoplana sp. BE70]|uniref:site-specific integrase n=1 Tax=Mycoplana sp. BE70 TaxID=2817775 RepID=UPI00285C7B63|nr:site-specific integrase [Mycoplana sp. BE70]MDR6758494.1 integrase [Mycoplana sp. BE70]